MIATQQQDALGTEAISERPPGGSSTPLENQPQWSVVTQILFRFVFAYFFLMFGIPTVLSLIPGLGDKLQALLNKVVPWVGSQLLHVSCPIAAFNGSGDTTYSYLEVFFFVVCSVAATLVWSLLDRKRTNYVRLHQWLRLGVRLVLGLAMLSYGAAKVMPAQMPAPELGTLLQPYGDSSPMRLLWTFIGASKGYEFFCGASEMLGGILLIVPGVTTLGALVGIAVLTNVFMLNLFYDVPVKLYSLQLLLMAVLLAAPDLRKLADLFLFQRSATLSANPPLFQRRWLNWIVALLVLLAGLTVAVTGIIGARQEAKQYAVRSPYYGAWSVDEYVVDGNSRPLSFSDTTRWRRVIFDYPQRLTVQFVDAPQEKFWLQLDQSKKSFTLKRLGDENAKAEFTLQDPGQGVLILDGQLDGHRIHTQLHREDERKFLLTSRGFHWINEYPQNR